MNIHDLKGKFKTGCVILDRAHGIDVSGKQSPDGVFKEWKWSKDRCNHISKFFEKSIFTFDVVYPFRDSNNEPGLRNRVNTYNAIAETYDFTLMLSLHVDAFKGTWWKSKGGFTFFTSRGETNADPVCDFIASHFKEMLPDETFRFDYGLSRGESIRDKDRERDYTVIAGYDLGTPSEVLPKYTGILIENNFMDVRMNYYKLIDPEWNRQLEDVYIYSILKTMNTLDFPINMSEDVTVTP